jgi:hypothetical protein
MRDQARLRRLRILMAPTDAAALRLARSTDPALGHTWAESSRSPVWGRRRSHQRANKHAA